MALNPRLRPNPIVMAVIEQAVPLGGEITSERLRAGLSMRLTSWTVCRALQYLVAEGSVTFEGQMGKRRYRRLPDPAAEIAA